MKKYDFSQLSTTGNYLLILKTLEDGDPRSPLEIQAIIVHNNIMGFNYPFLNKVLLALVDAGLVQKRDFHTYSITDLGYEYIELYREKLQHVCHVIDNFKKPSFGCQESDFEKERRINEFEACPGIKIIPYALRELDTANEKDFFIQFFPKYEYQYEFAKRGLGKGDFANHLAAFQNSNLIKFVAVIEGYIDDSRSGGKKIMKLRPDSICGLNIPISAKDISNALGVDFHFA